MTRVTKFETADGKLHDTFQKAEHHAEVRYSDAASALAARLVKIEKYQKMKTFLDEHLDDFLALKKLKDDITLPPSEEDEEDYSGPGRVRR